MTDRPDPYPVEPCGPVDATVELPGSKSVTNRALLCASLAAGTSKLLGVLRSDDTEAMETAVVQLGRSVAVDGSARAVTGGDAPAATELDARQSGTSARFLLPLCGLDGHGHLVDGDAQLRDRPMGPTLDALRQLGARVDELGGPGRLPVRVTGPYTGDRVEVAGDVSSQFLSGLLMIGPCLPDGLRVRLTTRLISRPYVEITLRVMAAFGAVVHADDDGFGWWVEPTGYRATTFAVEPDASAASYPWAAAVLTGGSVTVPGLSRRAVQGDVAFAAVLGWMGAAVVWDDDAVTVSAGPALRGISVSMANISDTVPTLASVAAFADGPTRVRDVDFIRYKETDRIAASVTELRRAGVVAEETADGFVVTPGPVHGASFDTYRDHRMAMATALIGLRVPGVSVRDPACVDKTFPGYWDMLDGLRAGTLPPARTV